MTYYKYLTADRKSPLQDWQWPEIGVWTPKVGVLKVCESGYHACRPRPHIDLLEWQGETLYEVELRGEIVVSDTKVLAPEARLIRLVETWNARTQRLFACDCIERQLGCWQKQFPGDTRIKDVICICRSFVRGEATQADIDAARSTADAAWSTADAAWSTAYAAWSTAYAARRTEREWQIERMMQYINGEIA